MKIFFFIYLCTSITLGASDNILIATPYVLKSLHSLFSNFASLLAENDHNVTFIAPYKIQRNHPNIHMVLTPQTLVMDGETPAFEISNPVNLLRLVPKMSREMVPLIWNDPNVLSLWEHRNNFDAIISMSYFSEYNFPFLMNNNASLILVCTPGVEPQSISRQGNWLSPAIVPSMLLNSDENMDFFERMANIPSLIMYYLVAKSALSVEQTILEDYFPTIGNIERFYDRVDLTLINSNFALDSPVPLLPSQVEIGLINIKEPIPLPQDIEKFMESSGEAGVIYFSIGSIASSTQMPKHAKAAFLEAFSQIPQKVLWKFDGDDTDMPSNVMTRKWMPQQDVLRHPQTRLFISHCGNLGTQEAKYYGVPVLGVPIFFDQPRNAIRMEKKGYAIVLQWDTLTSEKILQAMDQLINNPEYKNRLTGISQILKDEKESPAQRALWWIEYVLRHKGSNHLRYSGANLSLLQYLLVDVFAAYALAFYIIYWLISFSIKKSLGLVRLGTLAIKSKRNAQNKKKRQ